MSFGDFVAARYVESNVEELRVAGDTVQTMFCDCPDKKNRTPSSAEENVLQSIDLYLYVVVQKSFSGAILMFSGTRFCLPP